MSQKKVLLYDPKTGEEKWFMEDDAPSGWSNQPSEPDVGTPADRGEVEVDPADLGDTAETEPDDVEQDPDYIGDVKPGTPSEEQMQEDDKLTDPAA